MEAKKLIESECEKKRTFWSDLFGILDRLHLKKVTTRKFIFRPPSKIEYDFSIVNSPDNKQIFEFTLAKNKPVKIPSDLKIQAHKIFSRRNTQGYEYMIPLIYIYNPSKTSDNVIIYSHGNASDLSATYKTALLLEAITQMSVIAYDYTGYGISPHEPSEYNTYEDLEEILSYAVSELKYPLPKIFLWSFSLGSGPTVEIATRFKHLAGVILAAPLASCLTWMDKNPKTVKLCNDSDIYANINKIHQIGTKIIIFHGDADEVIPFEHSNLLYNNAQKVKEEDGSKAYLLKIKNANHTAVFNGIATPDIETSKLFMQYLSYLKRRSDNRYQKYLEKAMTINTDTTNITTTSVNAFTSNATNTTGTSNSTSTSTTSSFIGHKDESIDSYIIEINNETKRLNDKFKTLEIDYITNRARTASMNPNRTFNPKLVLI